jgi:hypothetical protein
MVMVEIRRSIYSILGGCFLMGLLALTLPPGLQAAEILTNDGQKFDGKIILEQPDYILMEIENGVQVKIDRSEIAFIEKEDRRLKTSKQEYPILGITYGSPSIVNLVAGYSIPGFGLKAEGADWAGIKGGQVDLSVKLVDNESFLANLSLVGGFIQTSGDSNGFSLWSAGQWAATHWTYDGVGFDINYGGFAFEADLVTGPFPNPIAIPIQIGYIQRFN